MTRTEPEQLRLRLVMADEADRMPASRVPEDLWRRGRRRHRRRIGAAVAAVLAVVLALPVALTSGPPAPAGAPAGGAVPGRVFDPWVWQAPVAQSPAGPAAVLLSGSGHRAGLGSVDLPGTYGSKIASVGRDGSYRMLRYADTYLQVGQDVMLSPDGRLVAGPDSVEVHLGPGRGSGRLSVVDLVTGRARHFTDLPADVPVAWKPDGTALLLWQQPASQPIMDGLTPPYDGNEARYGYAGGSLWLLDLATGATRKLIDLGGAVFEPINSAAFAPDGRHLVVQRDRELVLVDTSDGSSRTLSTLESATQRLAGAGAFTPDGARIALFDLQGCTEGCTNSVRNRRFWQLSTLDVATGDLAFRPRFDPVSGAAARVAGWQRDGTAVVVAYRDQEDDGTGSAAYDLPVAYRTVSAADLLALHRGGGTTRLIQPDGVDVWDIDVAHDLLLDGRFGGPSPDPAAFPAASWLYWVTLTPAVLLLLVAGLIVRAVRRRRSVAGHLGRGARDQPAR
nr:hypothetical protein GCM10020063_033760 [Dactylosporangium thailandense]